jgi:hypothetical protein
MASEPLIGKRMVKITEHRKIPDWAYFIEDITSSYKDAKKIILIMDNLNTLKPESQKLRNNLNAKINWQFTPVAARVKLKKLYPALEG